MNFPTKLSGLRWLTVIVGLYGLVWISLEGALWQVLLLATGLSLLGGLHVAQRLLGGRRISVRRWLLYCTLSGALVGLGCALLGLALMAIKTGLHGHGPEFTSAEIAWLMGQSPLWAAAGAPAGLGLGVLALGFQRQ